MSENLFEGENFGGEILGDLDFGGEICGIDEAGRGALAGELVVCGCVFRVEFLGEILGLGLNDSKKLSPKKREKIFADLIKFCDYILVYFRNIIIDEIGISECLRRALMVIRAHFGAKNFIFDGNCNYGVSGVKTMIKADAKIAQVSAASIIAKVSRDAQMVRFDAAFPGFGYASHKGYGVAEHIAALKKFGPNALTRQSFRVKSMEETLFGESLGGEIFGRDLGENLWSDENLGENFGGKA